MKYDDDFKTKVLDYLNVNGNYTKTAKNFEISIETIKRWKLLKEIEELKKENEILKKLIKRV